ncbi:MULTISPECIES: prepilin-type N-terminal cleavage/methylation domain-containing protein [Mesotoga]|uniref:prepilin-type N-terminal cleavage/methylation domain-containing protein n=1 Tax=Mesotoga TaxID=1184396 RepID=UPI002591DF35|nr:MULTISPECIES: prepilin-type N-terminal cleavage/methylation domain-containing protein [Mesotoga]HQC15727.1 prepilin-type N-terminal cleavage/methylation domain-containing protein [Mesotoga prima]HRX65784.1 prepilin-type N-terminal cleavage/methylation domain-containing protein [Mesotoga sp.]
MKNEYLVRAYDEHRVGCFFDECNENRYGRRGMTMTELLAALAVSTMVLVTVTIIASLSLKSSGQVSASMAIDEEITKLHTSMRTLVSRQWTLLAGVTGLEDGVEGENYTIELMHSIPAESVLEWVTTTSTVTYIPLEKRIVHIFQINADGAVTTNTISNYVEAFEVIPIVNFLTYQATFTYYDNSGNAVTSRKAEGAVRFY